MIQANLPRIRIERSAPVGDGKTAKTCLLKTEGKVTLWAWESKGEFIDFANWAMAQ